jgi:hypothetical protein
VQARGRVTEVEHAFQGNLKAVEVPGKQALEPDSLSLAEPAELGDRTCPCAAQVQDGKAARRIETPAPDPRSLGAQRVE